MRRNRTTRRHVLAAVSGVAAIGHVGHLASARVGEDDGEDDQDEGEPESELEAESPFEAVYRDTIDSVVLVQVSGTDGREGSIGSGFVYDQNHLVTNQHVVRGTETVSIQFNDERWRTGTVVGTDIYSDLAAIRVDDISEDAGPLTISDEEPVIGREVVALGNPLGFDASISQGIISGVDRSLPSPTGFSIPAAIQTDAPVNPGNSGGPLVGMNTEISGVVFAGAGQNIGFAIPAALVQRVVPALIEDGEYDHPYLGVGVVPVSPPIAEANRLEEARGVLVTDVVSGSPADGVLQSVDQFTVVDESLVPTGGDVIVEIDGTEIPNQEILSSHLALEASPGEPIDIAVVRDGERQVVELVPGERPDPAVDADSSPEGPGPDSDPQPDDPPQEPHYW